MTKPLNLSWRTAKKLIRMACGTAGYGGIAPLDSSLGQGRIRFAANSGMLAVMCENDWFDHCGRYIVRVYEYASGSGIVLCFDPKTLERDWDAEAAYRETIRREERIQWVNAVGIEAARKAIEAYWMGG